MKVYLIIGTNLGDRGKNLSRCLGYLEERGIEVLNRSSIYETEPWGFTNQPPFYNQAIEVETSYSPLNLLKEIKLVEKIMGREDLGRWKERLIDIDIIFYGSSIIAIEDLIIPHPEMQNRKFVLYPLKDIAGNFLHPKLKKTTEELLEECKDLLRVSIVTPRP